MFSEKFESVAVFARQYFARFMPFATTAMVIVKLKKLRAICVCFSVRTFSIQQVLKSCQHRRLDWR